MEQEISKVTNDNVLVINGGSSSIKFAFYQIGETFIQDVHGSIERPGSSGTNLTFINSEDKRNESFDLKSSDIRSTVNYLIDRLEERIDFSLISGIGHRVIRTNEQFMIAKIVNKILSGKNKMETNYENKKNIWEERTKSFIRKEKSYQSKGDRIMGKSFV